MGKFFNVDVKPDIVAGDISTVIDSDKGHLDIGAGEIIFDWTAVNVPKGTSMLRSITAIVNAEDATYAAGSLTTYHLIFAKSVNGVAPTTMGLTNAAQTGCFDLKDHYVGSAILESTAATGTISGPAFHVAYHGSDNSVTGGGLPLVIDLEPHDWNHTNVGYDKLYVMGFQMDVRGYHTAVECSSALSASDSATIAVDGTDATKIFSVGDTVYVHDVDTAIGTVKSVSALAIVLNADNAVAVANNDEMINANPIRLKLGFEK